jgi:hypothetical protein
MTAQHRTYSLTSLGGAFDGTSIVDTSGWVPLKPTNARQKRRSTSERLGRFPPDTLGYTNKDYALVKVWCNGPVAEGDRVEVRSSLNTDHGTPDDVLRDTYELGTSFADAPSILLSQTDDLCVYFETDGESGTVHVMVLELDEDQMFEWMQTQVASGETNALATETRTLNADATIEASAAPVLYVRAASGSANGTFTLPPIGEVGLGHRIMVYREGGQYFKVRSDGTETINGEDAPVYFPEDSMGVLFERTAQGWWSDATAEEPAAIALVGSQLLAVSTQRRQHVLWNPGAGGQLRLPLLADVAVGQEYEIAVTGTVSGLVQLVPQAGQSLNGIPDFAVAFGAPGDSVLVRRVPGAGWWVVTGAEQGFEERTQNGPGTLAVWRGRLVVKVVAAAATDVVGLPAIAGIRAGDSVEVFRDGGTFFVVDASGAEEINGQNQQVRFLADGMGVRFVRSTNGWFATDVAEDQALVSASGATVLTAWGQRRRVIAWDPGATDTALTLPSLSTVGIGQELLVVVSAQPTVRGRIIPAGGENLNAVTNGYVPVTNLGDVVHVYRTNQGWLAVVRTENVDHPAIVALADPALAAGWRGKRTYLCGYGAPGNFTLPPAGTIPIGCEVMLVQTDNNLITVDGNGNNITFTGTVAATRPLVQNVPALFRYMGAGWQGC